jgi:hypothetical protein
MNDGVEARKSPNQAIDQVVSRFVTSLSLMGAASFCTLEDPDEENINFRENILNGVLPSDMRCII